jgi:AcrR family transcriptional regulator
VTAVAERWTQERRREHTRTVLLDAAQEVFAARGFDGASLDDIAETAGYTRGAIYKHFADKAELFLAVNERVNEGMLRAFVDVGAPGQAPADLDLADLAKRWRGLQWNDARLYVLAAEFNLYLLRNPEARERVAPQRRRAAELIAQFIDDEAERTGVAARIPSLTLARLVLACSSGLEMATFLDASDPDLFEPFLALLVSAWG